MVTKTQMIMLHEMTVLGEGIPSEERLMEIKKTSILKKQNV